ncbi:MAG: hypothetical protein HKN91_02500 [Acidimicrobiia bacterium]|nr:hypothetical protein [Acidimicrobiia bacterium]
MENETSATLVDEALVEQAEDERERGATLVLASAVLVVLIGMAGFSVDLGWLYSQRTEATKAAESAALAGVVHMPNPTATAWGPGAEAFDIARDIADRKGYEHGTNAVVNPLEVAGFPNRLTVEVSRDVPTFFMRVFGVDTVSVDTKATAEQTPPLKIGSDEPILGGPTSDFWVAVNGTRRRKSDGDAFSGHCGGLTNNCAVTTNPEYRRPAYYYGVEVPPSEVGKQLTVEIFDGHQNPNNSVARDRRGNNASFELRFRLFGPDSTPGEPSDNTNVVCADTFYYETDTSIINQWESLSGCSVANAELGIYVLEVDIIENGPATIDNRAISAFAIRSKIDGSTSNNTAVFGLGSMSLWMPNSGSNPQFKLVKLEPFYAGTELILNLFDIGDLSSSGDLDIIGELASTDCEVRVRDANGNTVQNWTSDDGGAGCHLDISPLEYNNQWLDLRFDIPSTYTCSTDCWVSLSYSFAGNVTERTTITASINGLPVHLVP